MDAHTQAQGGAQIWRQRGGLQLVVFNYYLAIDHHGVRATCVCGRLAVAGVRVSVLELDLEWGQSGRPIE